MIRNFIIEKYKQNNKFIILLLNIYNMINTKIREYGNNNIVQIRSQFCKKNSIIIHGNNNVIKIDKLTKFINCKIIIYGNNHLLEFDEGCIIKNSVFWFEDNNCKIHISSNTTAEGANFSCVEDNSSIYIGNDCMLSYNIDLRTSDSHSIIDEENHRVNLPANIYLGNHVWVGAYVKILKGVNISDNCVIALGTVVTKSFSNNVLIGGIPGIILKKNINWMRERIKNK